MNLWRKTWSSLHQLILSTTLNIHIRIKIFDKITVFFSFSIVNLLEYIAWKDKIVVTKVRF